MPRHVTVLKSFQIRFRSMPAASAAILCLTNMTPGWAQVAPNAAFDAVAPSRTGEPLTLQAAVARAMSSNAELAAAKRELEAAEGPVLQAGARPNPELSFLLEDTQRATRTASWQISQPIEMGGQHAARVGAAERARDIAATELAAKRADLHASVVAAFFEVLLAQEGVALAADAGALARRATEVASKRVLAGKVSPVEETRARTAEANARLDAALAASALRLARQRLAAAWGDAVPSFDRLAPPADADAPSAPSFEALSARLAASPGLRRAQIEVLRRGALSALERAKQTPDLTVSLGIKRDEQLGRNQAVIGLSVPLPLFDRNQGQLLEALRREDKSRDELAAVEVQLRTALAQSWERLHSASTEAKAIRDEVLPGAQSAYDAATQGFALGKFDFLDVLDAQRTLFQAKAQILRTRGEALRAAAEIARLLGDGEAFAAR